MKKNSIRESKTRRRMRVLAWVALVCTVVLTVILLVEGLTPGDASAVQSDFIGNIVNSVLKRENDVEVNRIAFGDRYSNSTYHKGDTVKLYVIFYPQNATDKSVSYTVDDPSVATVNEDGELVFISEGTVIVTAVATGGVGVTAKRTYDCFAKKAEIDISKLSIAFETELTVGEYSEMIVKYDGESISNNMVRVPKEQGYYDGGKLLPYKPEVEVTVILDNYEEYVKTVSASGSVEPPESITLENHEFLITEGNMIALRYSVSPSDAPRGVVAEITDETILEYSGSNIKAIGTGRTQIKVKSVYSDEVYDIAEVVVYEHGSDVLGTPNEIRFTLKSEIKVGNYGYVNAFADDYRILDDDYYQVYIEGDSVVANGVSLLGVKAGEVTVKITSYGITETKTVTVIGETPVLGEVRVPSSLNIKEGNSGWLSPKYTDKKISSNVEFVMESSDPSVATVGRNGEVYGISNGECVISVTSVYDKSLTKNIVVNVLGGVPSEMTIVGDERIAYNSSSKYSVQYERNFTDDEVTWEVVDGPGTIGEDGALLCTGIGDIKLRAKTSLNSELVAEKIVHGVIYKSFKLFVRKFIGHFAAFGLLGVGVLTCCLLMLKKKWWSAIVAPGITFAVAGISEIFQLPIFTAGRTASFIDVVIDFAGSVIGMLITLVLLIVIYIVSDVQQGDFREELKSFSASSMTKKGKKHDDRRNKNGYDGRFDNDYNRGYDERYYR